MLCASSIFHFGFIHFCHTYIVTDVHNNKGEQKYLACMWNLSFFFIEWLQKPSCRLLSWAGVSQTGDASSVMLEFSATGHSEPHYCFSTFHEGTFGRTSGIKKKARILKSKKYQVNNFAVVFKVIVWIFKRRSFKYHFLICCYPWGSTNRK